MGKPRVPIDPVADLKRRLGHESIDPTQAFWTRYLHGAGGLRGVPITKVRACVRRWWADHDLEDHPATVGKRIALALIEQPMTEDKLAGIVVLHEVLSDQLRAADLPAFARLFARGYLADGDVADWFAIHVLVALLDRAPDRAEVARQLAHWRAGDSTWQRRAACLAFTKLAAQGDAALPGLTELVFTICATVVWSPERLDQTAVGWLLRELSRAEPDRVETFFVRHALLMSKECARCAVARLPVDRRSALLAHHKRATSLRLG